MKSCARFTGGLVVFVLIIGGASCQQTRPADRKSTELTPVKQLTVRSIRGTPKIDIAKYHLRIGGMVDRRLSVTLSELKARPSITEVITLNCVEGWSNVAKWTGIPLTDLLKEAGIRNEATIVIFRAADGYSTSLTLEDIKAHRTILAYAVDGVDLPKEHGYPLRLVVEGKYGYKWIKWIESIELARGDYKGYWESFGYDNEADVE